MKILFISHYFFPEGNAPATRVHQLARRWAADGHEVTVVTGVPSVPAGVVYDGYRSRLRTQTERIDGVRVVRVWTYIAANKGFVRRIANYVSFMASAVVASLGVGEVDVVVATSPQFFCGWAGAVAAWWKRTPFVLEIRDLWPESIVAVGALRRGPLLRSLEWLERRLYRAARHIVAVGDGYKEGLVQRGVSPERVTVIPNGVDTEAFQPRVPDETLLESLGLGDRIVCSYIGTIGMACGLDVVLRAARRLEEEGDDRFAFLLVGDGAVRHQLEESARRANLDSVIFTGRQPKERIPDLLAITSVCLVHLRRTPLFESVLPSKIFEALAMRRPILLGVEGEAADLVRSANGGLCFEPENESELVDRLRRFADEPTLGEELGRNGEAYVLEHFDRDRQSREYTSLLQRVAEAS